MDLFTLFKEFQVLSKELKGSILQKAFQGERGLSLRLRNSKYRFLNFALDPDASSFLPLRSPCLKEMAI